MSITPGGNWEPRADLDRKLRFPQQITVTSFQPDIVLWSTITKTVIMVELTVPLWEDSLESAYEKKEKYADLSTAYTEARWSAFTYPVEVSCRGFTGTSTQRIPKSLGVRGARLSKALKDVAEQVSFRLWLQRKGQSVEERRILRLVAGSGREMSPPLLHHPEIKGAKH